MEVQVGSGQTVRFHQDLFESALPEQVDLPDLVRGDQVWVRLRALRSIAADSWYRASRVEILSYLEESDD